MTNDRRLTPPPSDADRFWINENEVTREEWEASRRGVGDPLIRRPTRYFTNGSDAVREGK